MVFWTRFGLQGTKVGNDAIDMEVNKGLLAFFAEEEGACVKVHLTSHIGLIASVSYDGYLVNAFDSAKNNYHISMVPNLGFNFGLCFQIPGW